MILSSKILERQLLQKDSIGHRLTPAIIAIILQAI
jgi:hypothetical protein